MASIVEAQDDDLLPLNYERNYDPPFESDNAEAWSNVVASMATVGGNLEPQTISLETVQVCSGDRSSGTLGNPVVQLDEVCLCPGRQGDRSSFQRRALRRLI